MKTNSKTNLSELDIEILRDLYDGAKIAGSPDATWSGYSGWGVLAEREDIQASLRKLWEAGYVRGYVEDPKDVDSYVTRVALTEMGLQAIN